MTEKEYRRLEVDSYSTIRLFLDDRKKYYYKYVLGKKETSDAGQDHPDLRMGSLVDCLLLTPEDVSDRFIVTSATCPTASMGTFVNNLYNISINSLNSEGVQTRDIEDLISEAYDKSKYDRNGKIVLFKTKSLDDVKDKFLVKKIGYDYYVELMNRVDKIVITAEELEKAERVVEVLKKHSFTRNILSVKTESKYTVHDQLMLQEELFGVPLKCMLDKVIIDEESKVITPYDLKTTWNVDTFAYSYVNYRYYIQNAVYTLMLRKAYPGYTVKPLTFIVTDKLCYMDPVVYETTEDHINEALEGFCYEGSTYFGLKKALEDIEYHKATGRWLSSADVQANNGKILLKTFANV